MKERRKKKRSRTRPLRIGDTVYLAGDPSTFFLVRKITPALLLLQHGQDGEKFWTNFANVIRAETDPSEDPHANL
jgi:hypothetical protein